MVSLACQAMTRRAKGIHDYKPYVSRTTGCYQGLNSDPSKLFWRNPNYPA